eukprot:CAMPEP_0114417660 /NCGR_PEP_ID=MMETSP0103-20121206/3082_1 /TAXON_ID=37642 ORGANISM="Paraphysomonas imperforata, Strain PA2" /NCGR_SAMPLE_ID=MMETSP0103 /ASSEMBLY_ACC=CAM_ASM_000201 /LENGTH=797 /DNA_ID=CAMNT_0001585967 /DNA_START=115 /DNA_END=2508 /DNA_ORIENTATION=+
MAPVKQEFSGKLYSGDSYIFLHSKKKGNNLVHDIFFWLGKDTSQDESGVAAYKTVELDEGLGGGPVQYREVEGNESPAFASLFKHVGGLQYLEGGVASGFKKVERDVYETKLLMVKGSRNVRVKDVAVSNTSLNTGDVFILDMGLNLYLYFGENSNKAERSKGLDVINKIRNDDRGGRAVVTLLSDDPRNVDFWTALGGYMNVTNPGESDSVADAQVSKLFRISDDSGSVSFTQVEYQSGRLNKTLLNSSDAFLLDNLSELFLWVGKAASADEKKSGMSYAMKYLTDNGYPNNTSISKMNEGTESPRFISNFNVWNPPRPMTFGTTVSAGVAKTQADEDIDISSLLSTTPVEDVGFNKGGKLTIWRIEDFDKAPYDEDLYGQFWGGDSYVVLYAYMNGDQEEFAIYFWLGDTSSQDERGAAAIKAQELDDSMGGSPVQVRVTQGKEPAFFRELFDGRMVVHTGGVASGWKNKCDTNSFDEDGVGLYRIRGNQPSNVICTQIEEKASQLNSCDAFVLTDYNNKKIYAWKGAGASDAEAQAAFNNANVLANTGAEIIEVKEGEEPEEFWTVLGGKTDYCSIKEGEVAPRDPRLFQCSNATGSFKVEEVFYFEQEDLCDEDVMLLDCFTTVFLWVGSQAHADEKRKGQAFAEQYNAQANDGRDANTTTIMVHAGSEPAMFTSQFLVWDPEYTKKNKYLDPYEAKMAAIAKERAEREAKEFGDSAPVVEEKKPVATASSSGTFSYEDLKTNNYPDGAVDVTAKETFLSDADFEAVFGQDKASFSALAKWKRDAAKKKHGLF